MRRQQSRWETLRIVLAGRFKSLRTLGFGRGTDKLNGVLPCVGGVDLQYQHMAGDKKHAWSLLPLKEGKPNGTLHLSSDVTVIGRDAGCELHFPDGSISRKHAELDCENGTLRVRDLGSRNGIRVNGVPRKDAVLQHGDLLEVGSLAFQVVVNGSTITAPAKVSVPTSAPSHDEQTRRTKVSISKLGTDRSLSTLYHVCGWLAEDVEEDTFADNCLRVLLEGLDAVEVHLYESKAGLSRWATAKKDKLSIKLVPFLISRYSTHEGLPEALAVTGAELRKHQAAVAPFNFLLAPLRSQYAEEANSSFVAVLRPAEWNDFTREDRVLLQTICQLWVRALQRVRNVAQLRSQNENFRKHCQQPRLIGTSKTLEKLRETVSKAAKTNITVTLLGETGSGKEVAAHLIHQESHRSDEPFVKVNCAAIPASLIESELFGHEKGAFTDARAAHRGKFEQAHGGTLFLDEIGELPLALQGKFLRALETGEIEKLGSENPKIVDVRIIAASHRDLREMVKAKTFREDLFYRLDAMTLHVPPLRDHPEDIEDIAAFFLTQFCAENGLAELELSADAVKTLRKQRWPGNVRELRNVIQRCAVYATEAFVDSDLVKSCLNASTKG